MDKDLNYKVVEKMSMVVDNLLECVTIEIRIEKKKSYCKLHIQVTRF